MESPVSTVNDAASSSAAPPPPPPAAEGRRLRSCRFCRKQKLRCDGTSPCQRCRTAGVACVYDQRSTRRHPPAAAKESRDPAPAQSQQIEALSAQVQRLQTVVDSFRPMSSPSSPRPLHSHQQQQQQQQQQPPFPTSSGLRSRASSQPPDWQVLAPHDLEVPVTAVHVMTHPSPRGQPQRNTQGWTPSNQSKWNREEYHVTNTVERGLIDELRARRLFSEYMQSCNNATPFIDPLLDTYESVSELYPLTLAVILYLAARQTTHSGAFDSNLLTILEIEAKRLTSDTLFINPCSLDSVKSMLLLAVHSDKTHFAVGHAHQMAVDLGLDQAALRATTDPQACTRYDFNCARIWVYLVYFERAVALGARRPPRCPSISTSALESLVEHKYAQPSDIFFCASLELFDTSAGLRHLEYLPTAGNLETDRTAWFTKWSASYDKQCVHASSLQRVHLEVQMMFAKAWQLAIILGRHLQQPDPQLVAQEPLLDQINHTYRELSQYISHSDTYNRYFPWAPTCEVLFLTFTVILGRKAMSMSPDEQTQRNFLDASEAIARLVRKHPCQRYTYVVDSLLHLSTSEHREEPAGGGDSQQDLSWLNYDYTPFNDQFDDIFGDWAMS